MSDQRVGRLEVAPEYDEQASTIEAVLEKAYRQGGWTIAIDEGFELTRLGLIKTHQKLLTQGRSKGISVVTGVQRPSYVSRWTFSESSHVISFRHEGRDIKTMKDAYGETHANAVAGLDKRKFQFAWTSVSEGTWTGNLQDLAGRPSMAGRTNRGGGMLLEEHSGGNEEAAVRTDEPRHD